ncbi:uncharacterized protein SAPINGB_P002244 [Magnusiomyces paraingens]|uniref:Inactive metallocarboxypeptidase ECM14 n=1 Tax=Magnusiomyces paraingens TaxID=2606893 RepID=A0A5E8BEA6_9ASCO|nr:uncharacterized protein SAPINGB_P002244 [Saprochaete ingens]VVT49384.1 unnamed protein product [Saprochaete ingens]
MKTISVACKTVLLAMVAGSAAAASGTGAAATGLEQTVFSAVKDKLSGLFWRVGQQPLEEEVEEEVKEKEGYVPDWSQYEDETVLRFNWTTARERKAFVDATKTLVLDVWRVGKHSGDVRLHQARVPNLLRLLPKSLRRAESRRVMIADLEHAVHSTQPESREVVDFSTKSSMDIQTVSELFFSDFRSLESIYQWLDILEETFPEQVRTEVIGKTHEGRDIRVYHLYSSQRNVSGKKKTIVITGGTHAREWVSVSTVLYSLYTLLVHHGSRGNGAGGEDNILDKLDFLIVPVLNPDGYVYTWEHDRLWRKNRQDTGVPLCRGIDIDSSFPYHWKPSMGTPCSEGYAGQAALEAEEARAFTKYINATSERHQYFGYLDWHSYSQTILHPYGYSCKETPRDAENLLELAYGMARAIRWSSGKMYSVLPSCEDREYDPDDSEGGCALDYMYKMHAIWALQIKLRDTGNHGFLLPKKFIVPVGEEIFSALRYFCDFILNPEDESYGSN